MLARTKHSTAKLRILEADFAGHSGGDHDRAPVLAIEIDLDQAVRSRHVSLKPRQNAEPGPDFSLFVPRPRRAHSEHMGGQIIGGRRSPRMTSAGVAGEPFPVFLEGGVAALDLRPPSQAKPRDYFAPVGFDDRLMDEMRDERLRGDHVLLIVERHVLRRYHLLAEVG